MDSYILWELTAPDSLINSLSVDTTMEELERRLQEWPSNREADKKKFRVHAHDAEAAESSEKWEQAGFHYWECFRLVELLTKSALISQELRWWLVKRIHVPLVHILHFRLEMDKDVTYAVMASTLFVNCREEGSHPDRQMLVIMFASVRIARGTDEIAQSLKATLGIENGSSFLGICLAYLILEYYRVGRVGDAWKWIDYSKTVMSDAPPRIIQRLSFLEAGLLLEVGEIEKAEELILKVKERGNVLEDSEYDVLSDLQRILHTLESRLGIKEENLFEAEADSLELECIMETQIENLTVTAPDGFLHKYMSVMQDFTKRWKHFRYTDTIRRLESLVHEAKSRGDQAREYCCLSLLAKMHHELFYMKELRSSIDSDELDNTPAKMHQEDFVLKDVRSLIDSEDNTSPGEIPIDIDHHTCEHELPDGLLRNPLACPRYFRAILKAPGSSVGREFESDGYNLHHLETAIGLLNNILSRAGDIKRNLGARARFVHRDAGLLHFEIAEYKFCKFRETFAPDVLIAANCHTTQQVKDLLETNGICPEPSFLKARDHFRQSAKLHAEHLNAYMKSRHDLCVPIMEMNKNMDAMLPWVQIRIAHYEKAVRDLLQEALELTGKDASSCSSTLRDWDKILQPEILLSSERGRARLLAFQLYRVNQQEATMQEISRQTCAFDLHDKHAYDDISHSLSACGDGTIFIEYTSIDSSDLGGFLKDEDLAIRGIRNFQPNFIFGIVQVMTMEVGEDLLRMPLYTSTLEGENNLMILRSTIQFLRQAFSGSLESEESELENSEANVIKALEVLYHILIIGPGCDKFLKKFSAQLQKLVICPDQIFTSVPFAILRNPLEPDNRKGYLFQNYVVSITPSLRNLKWNNERYQTLRSMKLIDGPGSIVAFGDPLYRDHKRRLEKTGAEVEFISSLFPGRCAAVKHEKATVQNLLNWVKLPVERSCSQAFVHIGAHAGINEEYKHGRLMLTQEDAVPYSPTCTNPSKSTDFASSSRSGILSADDIVQSNILWRAHMVVLSACSSGVGEVKADGVLNLPRAFMAAGVPCSVVSQWPVEDGCTEILMKWFYTGLLEGMDVAIALRSAMLHMMEDGQHSIKQLGPFMVWGLPTVCLPTELLRKTKSAALLETGKQIIDAQKRMIFNAAGLPTACGLGPTLLDKAAPAILTKAKQHINPNSLAEALRALNQSLDLMKADKDHIDKDALVECLLALAECEMNLGFSCYLEEAYVEMTPFTATEKSQRLDSAIRYLMEALEYSEGGGSSMARRKRLVQLNLQQAYSIRVVSCGEPKIPGLTDILKAIDATETGHEGVDQRSDDIRPKAEEYAVDGSSFRMDPDQQRSSLPDLGDLEKLTSTPRLTAPMAAERLASCLSPTSCAPSYSDSEWESMLPPSYADILAQVQDAPASTSSKKEIYDFLCNRVLLPNGTQDYWLDRGTGGICQSIGARGLTVVWGANALYWNWGQRRQGSRFTEIAYVRQVCWLEVKGRLQCSLHPGTYVLSWRLSYESDDSIDPLKFSLDVTGNEPVITQCRLTASGAKVTAHPSDGGQRLLPWRWDASRWMEVDVGEFSVASKDLPIEVNFSMREIESNKWKSGLYLDGIVLRPSSLSAKQAREP